jgi:general secretion pathway protein D
MLMALAGCAGQSAFREANSLFAEGQVEPGLAKLEEAVRLDPRNPEYRIALATRRAALVAQYLAAGEAARREGRLSESEQAYRQVQGLDPHNAMARQGQEAVVTERRHRQMVAAAEALYKKGSTDKGSEADLTEALEQLRPVLSENPGQKDALNLKARVDEARARFARPEAKLAAAYRKPITLEFRDAPLKAVFDVVSKVSGLNFFFDKDIRPDLKATVLARNTSIEDAVRLLLVTNQLEQKVLNENSILIYPSTPQKLKEYQTLSVRTFYLTNADVKAVSNTIKTLVKTRDLVIDERLGIIMMRDTPEAIRMAERIVALQDLSDPEVVLDVEVLEVKRSRLQELGVRWPGSLTLSPLTTGTESVTLSTLAHLRPSTTKAVVGNMVINANKEDQDGDILANPHIRVRNKEKAKILIGDRVPIITTTSTSTGFVSESVNYVDVGLKLEVEPNIYLDEEVAIKVNLEVSSLVKEVISNSGTLSYQIGTRGANTVLRLKDGETQILAGLINDEERSTANKVPVLGDLPLAGRLFGSNKEDKQRSEILLSITPRIVRSLRRPDLLAAEFESGTESSVGAAPLRLSSLEPAEAQAPAQRGTAALQRPAAAAPGSPAVLPAAVAPGAAAQGLASNAAPVPPPGAAAPAPAPGLSPAAAPGAAPPALPTGNIPAALPAATSGAVAAASAAPISMAWQAPVQVRVGEQFSAVLRVQSQAALRGLPLLVGFDPQALQVVNVQEGDFFKQAGGRTSFNQRVDPAQGKVFVALVRQNAAGTDAGINGAGGLVMLTFKAVKPGPVKLQLLSASPEPPGGALQLPLEQAVRVLP